MWSNRRIRHVSGGRNGQPRVRANTELQRLERSRPRLLLATRVCAGACSGSANGAPRRLALEFAAEMSASAHREMSANAREGTKRHPCRAPSPFLMARNARERGDPTIGFQQNARDDTAHCGSRDGAGHVSGGAGGAGSAVMRSSSWRASSGFGARACAPAESRRAGARAP